MSCTINITSVTENSITFHWATTQYRYVYLWYGTNESTVANATSTSGRVTIDTASGTNKSGDYTLTGLSSYTTYYLKLGERSTTSSWGGSSTYSSVISGFTVTPEALSSPTNLDSTPSYLTADVSWDAVTNATGYVVYYKKSTDASYQSVSSTTNSATLSSLTDGSAYTWYVVALGNDLSWLDSDASESDTFTTLAQTHLSAPTNLSTNLTSTSAELSWSTVANATSYVVYYKESGNTTYQTIERSTNSATIDSLSEGTRYYWHVVAVGNGSNYGDSIPSSDEMFQPEGFCVTSAHNIYVTDNTPTTTITWDYLDGAASYKVDLYRYPDSGEVLLSTETTQGNSAVVDLPDKIEVYVAIVTALSSSNETLASKEIFMRRNARLRFMDLRSSTAELWVDGELLCDDITYYLMGLYADGTNTTTAATFTNDGKGLQLCEASMNATTYGYRVEQAFAIGGGTRYTYSLSDIISGTQKTRTELSAPSGVSLSYLSLGEIDLRWTAVANAQCYLIEFIDSFTVFYRCWSETNYVEAKSDLFVDKSVETYIYAYPSATGLDDTYRSSSARNYSRFYTFSSASYYPVIVATEVKARYATIMWDASDYTGTGTSLTLYEYDVATGTKTQVGTISAQNASTTLENLTPETKYAIIGNDGSRDSNKLEFTTPPVSVPLTAPTGLIADQVTSSSARVGWNAVTHAVDYRLEYRVRGNGTWIVDGEQSGGGNSGGTTQEEEEPLMSETATELKAAIAEVGMTEAFGSVVDDADQFSISALFEISASNVSDDATFCVSLDYPTGTAPDAEYVEYIVVLTLVNDSNVAHTPLEPISFESDGDTTNLVVAATYEQLAAVEAGQAMLAILTRDNNAEATNATITVVSPDSTEITIVR